MARPTKSNALLILFPQFNTLDMNGPLEVLRKSGRSTIFDVTIASETEITKANEGAWVQNTLGGGIYDNDRFPLPPDSPPLCKALSPPIRPLTSEQRHTAIDQELVDGLDAYDLLVVPGGPPDAVMAVLNDPSSHLMQLIKKFSELHPRSESVPRILLSICTGALFLGKLGIFNDGRYCTTHWGSYQSLVEITVAAAGGEGGNPAKVLPARYVDSGLNTNQVRIISSGGISCGMDAALHVVRSRAELLLGAGKGETEARETAEILDYGWRKTEGVTFDAEFL